MSELEEIAVRADTPRLLVAEADPVDGVPASVYEEDDGLPALCYLPENYSEAWQNALAKEIVQAYEDRKTLLRKLDEVKEYVEMLDGMPLRVTPDSPDYDYWLGRTASRQSTVKKLRGILGEEEAG